MAHWDRTYNNPTEEDEFYTCMVDKPKGWVPAGTFPKARMAGTPPDEEYFLDYMEDVNGMPGPNLWDLGPKHVDAVPRHPSVKVEDRTKGRTITHDKPQVRDGV